MNTCKVVDLSTYRNKIQEIKKPDTQVFPPTFSMMVVKDLGLFLFGVACGILGTLLVKSIFKI